jgi:hypothetical protein
MFIEYFGRCILCVAVSLCGNYSKTNPYCFINAQTRTEPQSPQSNKNIENSYVVGSRQWPEV